MSTRPSFQFYPADWRTNAKLRLCSDAARGAWIDILCVLHASEEYGVVRYNLRDLRRVSGAKLAKVRELVKHNILKGSDTACAAFTFTPFHAGSHGATVTLIEENPGPCWYCSRMVVDEYVRKRRGRSTQFSDTNPPPKQSPKVSPKVGLGEWQGDGSSSSSSSSEEDSIVIAKAITPSKSLNRDFEEFWKQCPRKVGKGAARRSFFKALTKTDRDTLSAAMSRYATTRKGEPVEYTVHPATWLNQERWLDEAAKPNGGAVSIALDPAVADQERENLKRLGIPTCS